MERVTPYKIKFNYSARTNKTDIYVDGLHGYNKYDTIDDYLAPEERDALEYQILRKLYAGDIAKENSQLRRENQQLRSIIKVYEEQNEKDPFYNLHDAENVDEIIKKRDYKYKRN